METWYSVTVEVVDDDRWRPLEHPWTQVFDGAPEELIDNCVVNYELADEPRAWRIRVYAGYNRYDEVITVRTGGTVEG